MEVILKSVSPDDAKQIDRMGMSREQRGICVARFMVDSSFSADARLGDLMGKAATML
jgi:hypothetical protein